MMADPPSALRFSKMHGAGNDFVIVDARDPGVRSRIDRALVARLGERHRGIGFDQLMALEPPERVDSLAAVRIYNSDGGLARQCGNGVRCLAAWLVREGIADPPFTLDTPAGPVQVTLAPDGRYQVALAVPQIDVATHELLVGDARWPFARASIGNPHAVVEVESLDAAPVAALAAALQADARFPDSCNVGVAQVLDRQCVRLRVVERGVGETLACGSAACAAAAVLIRRGRVDSPVAIELPGGTLQVDWPSPTAPVRLTGPVAFVFEGETSA